MERGIYSQRVREHARLEYIEPARRRGDSTVRIVAGEVQKAVRLSNRISLVCQALKSHKFLDENHLALEKWDGPPSGMSTTVTFTYRLTGQQPVTAEPHESPLLRLQGIAKEVFQSLGGGEAFIRSEREQFYEPGSEKEKLFGNK